MASFYPPDATDRSRKLVHEVCAAVPNAVLIGGWGTWVRLRGAMSHDIDLIVSHADMGILRGVVGDVSQSAHVGGRKYRGTYRGVHLDLYIPYESRLGTRLQLRTEQLFASGR